MFFSSQRIKLCIALDNKPITGAFFLGTYINKISSVRFIQALLIQNVLLYKVRQLFTGATSCRQSGASRRSYSAPYVPRRVHSGLEHQHDASQLVPLTRYVLVLGNIRSFLASFYRTKLDINIYDKSIERSGLTTPQIKNIA